MKQRFTYIRAPGSESLNRTQYEPKDGVLSVPGLDAAREHQLTLTLDELPAELVAVLEQSRELHVRWAAHDAHASASPYNARVSPGLHVFWTPEEGGRAQDVCGLLKRLFSEDIGCQDEASFSTPPILSPRFTSSPALQFHSIAPSTANLYPLQAALGESFCATSTAIQPCLGALSLLPLAASLDLNWDAVSHALVVSAFWSAPVARSVRGGGWRDKIAADPAGRVEVGVLGLEPRTEDMDAHELRLGGLLTVVEPDPAEQKRPGAALFTVPARHHAAAGARVLSRVDAPAGLHPVLRLSFSGLAGRDAAASAALDSPRAPACALHAYLTLPRTLFLDRHTLTDAATLAAHNLSALHALSGAADLEAPAYTVPTWGSAALLELAPPPPGADAHSATVPLHARYAAPADGGFEGARVPAPAVFWACPSEATGAKFGISPFDRRALGYDALFGDRTLFRHVQAVGLAGEGVKGALVEEVPVPVLDSAAAATAWIAPVTAGVVLAGFAWLVWTLVRPVAGGQEGKSAKASAGKEKEKDKAKAK